MEEQINKILHKLFIDVFIVKKIINGMSISRKKAVASEMLLTVGVLIAVGIALIQIKTVFYSEEKLSQQDLVNQFARDIESIIDKSSSVTGNASFSYNPQIKKYTLRVKDRVIIVEDRISDNSAKFTKSHTNIKNTIVQDSKTIYISKIEDDIFIFGRCLELGEECSGSYVCCDKNPCWGDDTFTCKDECAENGQKAADDYSCCSKYINETTDLCDEPPFCPESRVCPGAAESKVIAGEDCCPDELPACSSGHCCPEDKIKWCEYPKDGNARCMNTKEYDKECDKPENIYVVSLIPAFYSDINSFKARADVMKEFTENVLPFKENPATLVILIGNEECEMSSEDDISSLKICGNNLARKNGYPSADITGGVLGVCAGGDGCGGVLGYTMPNQGWFITGYDICSLKSCPSNLDAVVVPHEIGHNFRLCEGYCYQGKASCYAPERSSFGGYCGTSRIEQKFPDSKSATSSAPCGGCGPSVCCKGRILDNDPENELLNGRDIMGPGSAGSDRNFACDSYLAFKEVAITVFNFDLPAISNIDIEECYNHIKGDTYP